MPEPGCARPTGKVIGQGEQDVNESLPDTKPEEKQKMAVQVGRKAPDFEAPAYLKGEFINVKLSDAAGKWILLCFYPGDFTFV